LPQSTWPGEVSVRKLWPDTIIVRVARRDVVGRWADTGYLTPRGDILATADGPTDVPVFDCALSSPGEAADIFKFLQEMAGASGMSISRVTENAIGEWQLGFSVPGADPTVMLGAERLPQRMRRFLAAWAGLLGQHAAAVDYVDLRYENGSAVRWREPSAQHAQAMETTEAAGTT